MSDSWLFARNAQEYQFMIEAARKRFLLECRLPAQVFDSRFRYFLFAQFDEVMFGNLQKSLIKEGANLDGFGTVICLDPNPEEYFFPHFGYYNAFKFHLGQPDEYQQAWHKAPVSSPVAAMAFSSFVLVAFPEHSKWAIWAERDSEIAIIGIADIDTYQLVKKTPNLSTLEDCLATWGSQAFGTNELFELFSKELKSSYSGSREA